MRVIYVLGILLVFLLNISTSAIASLEEAQEAFKQWDYNRALELYMPLAEQGNLEAMVKVARIYLGVRGVTPNRSEALKWYRSAALKGSADGAFGLANMHCKGLGTERDYKAAADLYRQAAEKGHGAAAYWLGNLYYTGRGVVKDHEQAVLWFSLGAERGNLAAEQFLNRMKAAGHLTPEGTLVSKSDAPAETKSDKSVVIVKGPSRQTLTAIHPGTPPVKVAQDVEESPKGLEDLSRTEYWAMAISGFIMLLIAPIAFFFPKAFMYGRRSFFWRELLGERRTATMIRVISIIVGIMGIIFMFSGIYENVKG